MTVPTDGTRRMDPVALAAAMARCVAEGQAPIAVVATAGTTDFGAIDPLPQVADAAASHGAWLHVDAAYGGGLLVSRRRRHLLAGIERADSVTVDFHKTFFQPVSSSAVVVRDRATLAPVTWHADYLNPAGSTNPDQVGKSLQTTRRFDALKLWLTLRTMGPDLVGDYVDAVVDLAHAAYDALRAEPALEIAAPPHLSTLVLRYRPPGAALGEADLGRLNRRIRAALFERGTSVVAATKVDGRQFLKLTLLNPKATLADVLAIAGEVCDVGRELAAPAVAASALRPTLTSAGAAR
ncbi:pyridoxal-dependent decarboxylase [Nocardioides sp. TF02-7]|uniref:pyridoxal phosphate-dependent decarboxylase family protein n=1 Tax=Nocardioides sp. TF02-7 TaxID=2917724 RepID=UPI0023DC2D70|nr:pyridoxal-dependent decarboxylase [Nocardioides sp. TF02-7]